jgi:twinkle protein
MANPDRGAQVLDMARAGRSLQSIADEDIDFRAYAEREERARVIPAVALAEEGKRRMLLGAESATGLTLPWLKATGKVRIAPGKLVIWCGWSHHGKTNMAKHLMLHAISEGQRVCIASMEEEMHEVWEDMGRMACGCSEPTVREINRWIDFGTGTLWFYDQQGTVSAAKIKTVIRYCAEELGITQFVVDSLMMLAVDRDDYDAQSRFVGELKALAKDTKCTIHLVAHMRKRDGKIGEEQPGGVHDIAGAHDIGSKADYIFNVWRDKARKIAGNPECVLTVEKQRGRPNWIGRLALNYHPGSRQYVEDKFPMRYWSAKPPEPGDDDEIPR